MRRGMGGCGVPLAVRVSCWTVGWREVRSNDSLGCPCCDLGCVVNLRLIILGLVWWNVVAVGLVGKTVGDNVVVVSVLKLILLVVEFVDGNILHPFLKELIGDAHRTICLLNDLENECIFGDDELIHQGVPIGEGLVLAGIGEPPCFSVSNAISAQDISCVLNIIVFMGDETSIS